MNLNLKRGISMSFRTLFIVLWALPLIAQAQHEDGDILTYRGIPVAEEQRCSAYRRDDYRYSQSVEDDVIKAVGGIYGPYTGTCYAAKTETDIEHIVALSEAHDSGLCAASLETRRAFGRDLLNLTLASPQINRTDKGARDIAEWLPRLNQCWYVQRTLDVRRKYGLNIDWREALSAEAVLASCESTEIEYTECMAIPDLNTHFATELLAQLNLNDRILQDQLARCQFNCDELEAMIEKNALRLPLAERVLVRVKK